MYVWFDALTNYLTALGFGSDHDTRVAEYWPTVTHLIGKEILRQHALYWPAFLMSAGLQPPRRIIAHGWWLMGGAKMSKSIGNIARYQDYVSVFGVDALRYFVMREMPLGGDANFSDEGVLKRFNSDLANDLGNVVSRTMTMIHRYCGGRIPDVGGSGDDKDRALSATVASAVDAVRKHFDGFQISLALQATWGVISSINQYLVEREPWALAKKPEQRPTLDRTLYYAADAVRVIAALIEPVMPETAQRIRAMLGIPPETWVELKPNTLAAGTALGPTETLFPRIEKTLEELRTMTSDSSNPPADSSNPPPSPPAETGPAEAAPIAAPSAPQLAAAAEILAEDPRVSIDEFMKVELRAARVLEAEAVPKSKKLIKLKVDVGTDQRTILAGIAEAYQPGELVNRMVVVVANLKPAKLMGIESNGMLLAASSEAGKPVLVAVPEGVEPGWRVR
jgi:methionyl-tRNA synthetase